MQIHTDRCPNCSRPFSYPVDYPGGGFRTICPNCHVGYDLVGVKVDEDLLEDLLCSHKLASWQRKKDISKKIFQYLSSVALEFRFVSPEEPNAIIFLVSTTRATLTQALYFHHTYHRVRPVSRLQFSVTLAAIGALVLLLTGLSLIPVLIGTILALLCFWRFTSLPKIKRKDLSRLKAEQSYLKQCYEFQLNLSRICQEKRTYQSYLQRQQSVLAQMMQDLEVYQAQIDLYHRVIKCTQDYLNLCDRAIEQYNAAKSALLLQIETSKLSADLSSNLTNPSFQFGLEQLEDQLKNTVPPKLS